MHESSWMFIRIEASGNVDDEGVGMRALHAQRRGHAVAHGAEAAGGHPVVRLLELEILRRPHLVLPDLGRDEGRAVAGQLVKPLDGMLRLDRLAALLELQAVEIGRASGRARVWQYV